MEAKVSAAKTKRTMMSARFLLLLAVCVAALLGQETTAPVAQGLTSAQVRAEAAKSGYIGDAGCRNCHKHDAIWDSFPKNPHFKSAVSSHKEAEAQTGCESCHGPGKAHVEAGGDLDTVVKPFSIMKPQEIIATCLACHGKEFNRANIRRSEHTTHEIACTSCHSIHKSQTQRNLLAKNERETCYQCHADVRSQFNLPFKHRVNEGLMTCSDCHNPHGGFTATAGMAQTSKMLNQAHTNEQPCMKCHVDKRGPFVFAHQAGEVDGCISCHKPHGSTNAKLITRPTTTMLCLECHTGSGNFGARTNRGITYPDHATHSMVDPRYQRCTGCHVAIHGSNIHYRFLR